MTPDPRRPSVHVTVPTGWLNDAYGVTWRPERGEYVLFFQHSPGVPEFDPRMSWAVTRSPDLVHWGAPEVLLAPGRGDDGCWSGAAVPTPEGLRLLYTGVSAPGWGHGRVVLVDADRPEVGEVVIPGPPQGIGVTDFRDPYVWPAPDGGWRMVLGAAIAPDEGAVFAYSGSDLRTWTYEGVLARAPMGGPGEDWTGSMWECPQLIEVDGAWVLILSIGHESPGRVVYAVGELDWPRFTPGRWRPLWHGPSPYATTAFRDRDGRPCVLSWCRESVPDPDSGWAGALSHPYLLQRVGDRLHTVAHPDVDSLRAGTLLDLAPFVVPRGGVDLGPVGAHADLDIRVALPPDGWLRCTLHDGADDGDGDDLLTVTLDAGAGTITLGGRGMDPVGLPLGVPTDGTHALRCLWDASVVEVVTASGTALLRCAAPTGEVDLTVTAGPDDVAVRSLTVHALSTAAAASPGPPHPGSSPW